ncbi:MAG: hypothetical protein QF745_07590, partial [Planctomycetota bacterium]|nr:hypothetical protein [Planctomycetota bacterium]
MNRIVGILLILVGLLINHWTLGLLEFWALASENPFTVSSVFTFDAVALTSGLLLLVGPWIPIQSPRSKAIAFLAILSFAGAATWTQVFAYKAPLAIAQMASWRFGSPMFAFPEEEVDWASEYALKMGVVEGKESLAVKLHISIGGYLLRVGRVKTARKHFETASVIAEKKRLPRKTRHLALRWIAVSHLREGEVEYCIVKNNEESGIFPFEGGGLWTNPGGARLAI